MSKPEFNEFPEEYISSLEEEYYLNQNETSNSIGYRSK